MNPVLELIYKNRGGNYCHCLEVSSAYELECIVEQLYSELNEKCTNQEIIEFFESMKLYCLDDENEDEIFNFSFSEFINQLS